MGLKRETELDHKALETKAITPGARKLGWHLFYYTFPAACTNTGHFHIGAEILVHFGHAGDV